jgi:hypothetical protein
MRSHHIVAFVVILVVGVGVVFLQPARPGETPTNDRMTVLRLQNDINLLR